MAPRASKLSQQPSTPANIPSKTLVVDNGAFTIKAGFASSDPKDEECSVIPNCIARSRDRKIYVGAQVDACGDYGEMAFRRPVEKGFIVNWEGQRAIWDKTFLGEDAVVKVREIFGYFMLNSNYVNDNDTVRSA